MANKPEDSDNASQIASRLVAAMYSEAQSKKAKDLAFLKVVSGGTSKAPPDEDEK